MTLCDGMRSFISSHSVGGGGGLDWNFLWVGVYIYQNVQISILYCYALKA